MRLIENWLINTPERGFEIPFCQLLISEGHRIVHIDSHSQQEEGKDVVSLDQNNTLCAYQIKQGNINVREWRSIQGELRELVELPLSHPRFNGKKCRPFLVVTGSLNQPALGRLHRFNQELPRRFRKLELVDRHDLLARFVRCQDSLFPIDVDEFHLLLDLLHRNGAECLDRRKYARFLGQVLEMEGGIPRSGEARRMIAGALIMASHAMGQHSRSQNHLAIAEGWAMAAVIVTKVASMCSLDRRHWREARRVACDASSGAFERLASEALNNQHLVSGDMLGDGGLVWRLRATLVAAAISMHCLLKRLEGCPVGNERECRTRVLELMRASTILGESAVSCVLPIFWFLAIDAKTSQIAEERCLLDYIRAVSGVNAHGKEVGIPSPYYTDSQCLEALVTHDPTIFGEENMLGTSYTVFPLTLLLVRRLLRRGLSESWADIASLRHYWMEFASMSEFLSYRARGGRLVSQYLPTPTSWNWLLQEVERHHLSFQELVTPAIADDPRLPLLLAFCYPHRMSPGYVLWLDDFLMSRF